MSSIRDEQGHFIKGVRSHPTTEFKRGQHWHSRKPFWDKEYLNNKYTVLQCSAIEIAKEHGCTENNILFWLQKHEIVRRTMTETRRVKKWGTGEGEKNPMFGRRGCLHPGWQGGKTPERQKLYSTLEWAKAAKIVRKRDKTCRLCEATYKLEIHHIWPFAVVPERFTDTTNLIRLCTKCHDDVQRAWSVWRTILCDLIQGG